MKNKIFISLFLLLLCFPLFSHAYAPNKRILFFLPYENYSQTQFDTLYQTLTNASYTIDVVSAIVGTATAENGSGSYTVPNTSSTAQTKITLGQTTISLISKEVFSDNYDALIIIGGSGAQNYFYDGLYTSTNAISTAIFTSTASTLNTLIQTALTNEKVIGGIEYGTGVIAFARLANTEDQGPDTLGVSILKNKNATTWDYNSSLVASFSMLGINLLDGPLGPNTGTSDGDAEPVVIDGPDTAHDIIITGRDNSAVTLSYFLSTLKNMLETYPDPEQKNYLRQVIVFGGDEPTKHSIPYDKIAKHTDIANNLNASSQFPIEAFASGDETWLNTVLKTTDKTSPNYYDTLVYFRMYATANQSELNQTIKNYVEKGGLLLVLHHGLFNDGNKKGDLGALSGLVGLAGGEIPSTVTDSQMVYPGPHYILNSNLGHFTSTYKVVGNKRKTYTDAASPSTITNKNLSTNTYFSFEIDPDELITLITVNPSAQITPIFSNGYTDVSGSTRFIGWIRNVGQGKVIFYEPGERNDSSIIKENLQVMLNAILWGTKPAANRYTPEATPTNTPFSTPNLTVTFTPVGTPYYEAKWISQTQGTGQGNNLPHLLHRGQKVQIEAVFQNMGNRPWYNDVTRSDFVGFYVYKDPIYSTPLEFNDPQSPLYGSSYFFDNSWGPSFDGKTANARAALLAEAIVFPGGLGHFVFNFQASNSAIFNATQDNTNTPANEYYYREDMSLAYGPNWMNNFQNGDPWNRAHVWFPIRVEE